MSSKSGNSGNSDNDDGITGKVIDGTAGLARTVYKWKFYISIVIGVIMLIASIYLIFFYKVTQTEKVEGVVDTQSCVSGGRNRSASCNTRVKYTINGKEMSSSISTSKPHNSGDNVILYYDPKNPSSVTFTKPGTYKMVGYVLMCMSVLTVAFSYGIYKFSQKNKSFASFMIVSDVIGRGSNY